VPPRGIWGRQPAAAGWQERRRSWARTPASSGPGPTTDEDSSWAIIQGPSALRRAARTPGGRVGLNRRDASRSTGLRGPRPGAAFATSRGERAGSTRPGTAAGRVPDTTPRSRVFPCRYAPVPLAHARPPPGSSTTRRRRMAMGRRPSSSDGFVGGNVEGHPGGKGIHALESSDRWGAIGAREGTDRARAEEGIGLLTFLRRWTRTICAAGVCASPTRQSG